MAESAGCTVHILCFDIIYFITSLVSSCSLPLENICPVWSRWKLSSHTHSVKCNTKQWWSSLFLAECEAVKSHSFNISCFQKAVSDHVVKLYCVCIAHSVADRFAKWSKYRFCGDVPRQIQNGQIFVIFGALQVPPTVLAFLMALTSRSPQRDYSRERIVEKSMGYPGKE